MDPAALQIPPDMPPEFLAALARPEAALLELDRLDYEGDLLAFLEAGWKYINPQSFVSGPHLEAIAEHLAAVTRGEIQRLIINIPPRMTKSSLVSCAWPAWTWAQRKWGPLSGPHVQFLHASYANSLSLRDAVRTRRLIQSPFYQKYWAQRFQMVGDQNAKQRFENSSSGYRLSTSVDGALTGEGGDIIVVDDPHNTTEIESEAIIDSTTMWWDEAMSTRLNNARTGAYVLIMQRLSEKDLTGHILSTQAPGDWTHLYLPMRYEPRRHCVTVIGWEDWRTEEGELLCPERIADPELAALERRLGPFGTAGQLQQSPVPRGGGIIKDDWWQVWPPEGEQFGPDGKPIKPLHFPQMDYIVASLDTAMTAKEESDYSALTLWGMWRNNQDMPQMMLMEGWAKRLEFHELVEQMISLCRKRKVDRLLVEAKNTGFSVGQEIARRCRGEGFVVTLEPVKGDKVARAYATQSLFAQGQVWAPERNWAQAVIDQCSSFPHGDHDDLVDSVTQALNHLRRTGLLQTREERQDTLRKRLAPHGIKEPLYDV